MERKFDFLVIGGGVAGLVFALNCSKVGTVAVLTKSILTEGATNYAQGGIAAVLSENDSFEAHIKDTMTAGCFINDEEAVRLCVTEGPGYIKELISFGAHFTHSKADDEKLDLTREGGHSTYRVAHAADATGAEVQRTLLATCQAEKNITFFSNSMAVDLITERKIGHSSSNRCIGAYVLRENGDIDTFLGGVVTLATGGAGKTYLYTSNPDVATGDGVAMAYRAGAEIANMEFYQFHPTCLYHPKAKSFLISEALRGEGGQLKLKNGQTFMEKYHPMGALAPRDVVARAIDAEMKRTGDQCVYLDMRHLTKETIIERFPTIYHKCLEFNIDMTKEPIPVVPAAHYMCGGIVVDTHGQTTIPHLLAIGECSYTGLHGANRLASNSLLEGLVYGHRASELAKELIKEAPTNLTPPSWDPGMAVTNDEIVLVYHNWEEIRRFMWNYVGIVRTNKRLQRAKRRLELLRSEIQEYYWQYKVTPDILELRNIADVAYLIVESALRRKESRGLHYNLDYPEKDDANFFGPTKVSKAMLENRS